MQWGEMKPYAVQSSLQYAITIRCSLASQITINVVVSIMSVAESWGKGTAVTPHHSIRPEGMNRNATK